MLTRYLWPYGLLLSCLAAACAHAHLRKGAQVTHLKMDVQRPCVSLANDDVAVLLPESVIRRVAEGKDPLQHDDHARRVWSGRAEKILAQAGAEGSAG